MVANLTVPLSYGTVPGAGDTAVTKGGPALLESTVSERDRQYVTMNQTGMGNLWSEQEENAQGA